jgi:adenosine deaminase
LLNKEKEHTIIKEMPKVELHLHLEGAFTFNFLFHLVEKYGGDPSINSPVDLKNKFKFKDFSHFINLWHWKNQFFKKADDFEELTYTTLEKLSEQNVIYCEVFYSPWDFTAHGLAVEDITEATLSGIRRAEHDYRIRCNLIADIVRDYGNESAVDRIRQIRSYRDQGVIGIGLGGSEQKFPAGMFKDAFGEAAGYGLRLTAHAGEAEGPSSVWSALNDLGVERIGHGVRAIEDPDLIELLKESQIPLEICVISNLKTKVFPSIKSHPVKYFMEQGLHITINSDDPAMFETSITGEFLSLYDTIGISLSDIKMLTENAINAAFITESEKRNYSREVETFWRQYNL